MQLHDSKPVCRRTVLQHTQSGTSHAHPGWDRRAQHIVMICFVDSPFPLGNQNRITVVEISVHQQGATDTIFRTVARVTLLLYLSRDCVRVFRWGDCETDGERDRVGCGKQKRSLGNKNRIIMIPDCTCGFVKPLRVANGINKL